MGDLYLDDHCIHLLFSANRWQAAAQIEKDIADGTTVVVDRYSYSGVVYSAAKNNEMLSLDWAWRPEVGLPRPDLWLFLDIAPEKAAERGGYGVERYENDVMQKRVRELFSVIVSREGGYAIDAGRSQDAVAHDILVAVAKKMESLGALQRLT